MARRPRFSIPTRIFLAFALALTAFGAVSITSLVQHDRTARTLRLLEEGYLPLALTLGEAKATQAVFATLLDRVLEESDSAPTRSWLNAARRVRPATLRRAYHGLERAERLALRSDIDHELVAVRSQLEAVERAYEAGDERYSELFEALEAGDRASAAAVLEDLRRRERDIQRAHRAAWRVMQELIATTSAQAAEQERRAAVVLGVLTVLSLTIGVIVTWWSQRVLSPLPLLHARVAAVADGDLSSALVPRRDDELGRLTREFEKMVSALAARDARLAEAAEAQRRGERLAAIGRMAAHVTHEVRNPLSSIGLNVEMLEDELAPDAEEARNLISEIQKEIDRLTALTEEYLRLARLPTPRLEPDDVGELAHSVAEFVRREMESSGVELDTRIIEPLPRVAIDEPQLRQGLLNLLRNAREAMPEGGALRFLVEPHEGGVRLRVEDEGEGVTPDIREKIFDMFYTTKVRGSGLGLPLTQQIVVAHGGRIRCEPGEGGGTAFEIWLPSCEVSGASAEGE